MLTIDNIYTKPEKILLLLKKNKMSLIEEAKQIVINDFFDGNINNKDLIIEFLAIDIIDVDNNYKISKDRLSLYKNIDSIQNNWLKWSLTFNRDIRDIKLVNSGMNPFSQKEMSSFFNHKTLFAKKYNIDLKTEELDMLYYKLYKVLGNEENGTFYKYYDNFKVLNDSILKNIYIKDLQSIEQLNFYLEAIKEFNKGNLNTKGLNSLLSMNYKYIEYFNSYDLNLIKLLNDKIIPSEKFIYKLIEFATKDTELIPLLKGFTKFSPGSFLKTIDPREDIEDQHRTDNTNITYKDDKPYIIQEEGEYMRLYENPDDALKKIYNEYLDVKFSPKLSIKNDDFKFTLDKLNIPYIKGKFEDYSYETQPLLIRDNDNSEIFNSEILVRGIIDKDCTTSFKDHYIMGWECIEQLCAYPEDNAYVIIKDPKGNDIASMYVTRAQDALIIDSIQYMKDLRSFAKILDSNDSIENHYHKSLIPTIYQWTIDVCNANKGIRKVYLGEGHDGLRLTDNMLDEVGIKIKKFSKSAEGKEKNFLTDIIAPYSPGVYNDFEDSKNLRMIYTTDPRLLSLSKVYEHIVENVNKLPNNEKILEDLESIKKSMKKVNKLREEVGFDEKYNMQGGVYADSDDYSKFKEYVKNKFSNNGLYDIENDDNDNENNNELNGLS